MSASNDETDLDDLTGAAAVPRDCRADASPTSTAADGNAGIEVERINKRDFIRQMALEAHLPKLVAERAYDAFMKTLLDNVRAGKQVNLTGFGKFYWQRHRGHPVRFGEPGQGLVEDYTVLKFSATRDSNEFLGLDDEAAITARVPGTAINRVRKRPGEGRPAGAATTGEDSPAGEDEESEDSPG